MIAFYDAINCYTDASITKFNDTLTACAGYCLVYRNHIIEQNYQVLYNSTNNFGEIYAVYMGVQALIRYGCVNDKFLNLFSDSRISIDGLTKWIKKWIKLSDNGTFIGSSGKPVINQEVFKSIIHLVSTYKMHMQMFHILGHINPSKISDMRDFIKAFKDENNVVLSEDAVREMCYYNYVVDNTSRNTLKQITAEQAAAIGRPQFIDRYITETDVQNYLSLLGE